MRGLRMERRQVHIYGLPQELTLAAHGVPNLFKCPVACIPIGSVPEVAQHEEVQAENEKIRWLIHIAKKTCTGQTSRASAMVEARSRKMGPGEAGKFVRWFCGSHLSSNKKAALHKGGLWLTWCSGTLYSRIRSSFSHDETT